MATAKKATANTSAPTAKTAKSSSVKAPAPKKAAQPPTKASAAKAPVAKATPAKAAPPKATAKKAPEASKAAPAKKSPAKAAVEQAAPSKAAAAKQPAAKKPEAKAPSVDQGIPPVKGETKDGIKYTKDFDAKFLTSIHALLLDERAQLAGQATLLEDEANALIAEHEMGDVQFDEEGGQGDTMVVERERDLALSAQARQTIADIDAALNRLLLGTYGYSVVSGRPIPRERLEAIPWAEVLVEEKVGGIGRR
jgi:RNA polymerase-binding transcription factor DksA